MYDSNFYTTYLGYAQAAVSALTSGAVASAVFGVCVSRSQLAAGASVVVGRCSYGTGAQRWALTGGALSHGGLCLTAGAGTGQPAVTLAGCDGGAAQSWAPYGLAGLRNGQSGRCLTDPGGAAKVGTPLTMARCTGAREQGWWLP